MFGSMPVLNDQAMRQIRNLYLNFMSHPNYARYSFQLIDDRHCARIEMSFNGSPVSLYCFYASPFTGSIGSISIYGASLEGHYKAINSSKNCFGFRVAAVELVTQNTSSPFVDVTLV
jgi:hypothetical protein